MVEFMCCELSSLSQYQYVNVMEEVQGLFVVCNFDMIYLQGIQQSWVEYTYEDWPSCCDSMFERRILSRSEFCKAIILCSCELCKQALDFSAFFGQKSVTSIFPLRYSCKRVLFPPYKGPSQYRSRRLIQPALTFFFQRHKLIWESQEATHIL